jgi:aryl-alcohol dehydrogenase-like predicted oxidoreductase
LSSSRSRRDERTATDLPLLTSSSANERGARAYDGPPLRFMTPGLRLGFGGWALGGRGWGTPGEERGRAAAVRRAHERGVTFFDTAPTYGDGESERILGKALRPFRDAVTIATKVGPHDDPRASLEGSLSRLAAEYVDLAQLHEIGPRYEWSLERLHGLLEQGKTRAIGLCNATRAQIARAATIAPIATYQGPYNLFDRDVEQRELPLCRELGLGFLAYRPLASGLLSGKYPAAPQFPDGDHRTRIYWFKGREFDRRRAVVDGLRPIAARLELPLAALALAWVLAQPGVSIVLAGARSTEQVDENLAGTGHLTTDTVSEIDAIVARAFRPARATDRARTLSASWGSRERFIVEQLDGAESYEAIAARWTDSADVPMIAAQVKVFVDQLADQGLVDPDA